MKKKIGEIQGRPLVIGDANIVTPNEIHVEEIKKQRHWRTCSNRN